MTNFYDSPAWLDLKDFWSEPHHFDGKAHDLRIAMRRNHSLAWCGYVRVPLSHPLHGKDYNTRVPVPDRGAIKIGSQSPLAILIEGMAEDDGQISLDCLFECPGGLTWAREYCPQSDKTIEDDGWWFGFDCNHYNDLSPKDVISEAVEGRHWREGKYRTFEWVKTATENLAKQLSEYTPHVI